MPDSEAGFEGIGGGGSGGGGGTPPPPAPPVVEAVEATELAPELLEASNEKQVPLGELIRCRKRAQEAEARAGELEGQIAELEKTLVEARAAVDAVERRQQIDLALMEADAMDLESARLLTEMALSQAEGQDVAVAVDELKRRKPFLFRTKRAKGEGSVMGGAPRQAANGLMELASAAATTGDRKALLRYLQARRGL